MDLSALPEGPSALGAAADGCPDWAVAGAWRSGEGEVTAARRVRGIANASLARTTALNRARAAAARALAPSEATGSNRGARIETTHQTVITCDDAVWAKVVVRPE